MDGFNKEKDSASNFGTILGSDTEFNGTMKFGKTLKVEGKFEGSLSSDGRLIVAKTGEIKAEIAVGNVSVEGKVNGNITAKELVELKSSAEVTGDVKAARLSMEDGVVFVGKAEIRPGGKPAPVPSAVPKPGIAETKTEDKSIKK